MSPKFEVSISNGRGGGGTIKYTVNAKDSTSARKLAESMYGGRAINCSMPLDRDLLNYMDEQEERIKKDFERQKEREKEEEKRGEGRERYRERNRSYSDSIDNNYLNDNDDDDMSDDDLSF